MVSTQYTIYICLFIDALTHVTYAAYFIANWSQEEIKKLEENIEKDWKQVAKYLPGKTCQQVKAAHRTAKRKIE